MADLGSSFYGSCRPFADVQERKSNWQPRQAVRFETAPLRLYVAGTLARCGGLYGELLANADRHGDKSVASRNIIDLAMMIGR